LGRREREGGNMFASKVRLKHSALAPADAKKRGARA